MTFDESNPSINPLENLSQLNLNDQKTEDISLGEDSSNECFACTLCPYTSSTKNKLDKHMERHVLYDGVHPCGKKRKKPEAFPQRHRHNAEEYRCSICPYSCTVPAALENHMSVHTHGMTNCNILLSCKICGEDQSSENEMQRHVKQHRNGAKFLCDLCNYSCFQLKKVIQHRRIHTGEKPHLCPHCNYRASRRDNLRSHIRRVHYKENMYIDTFNPC